MSKTYLVTGALGCIGAWTLAHLLKNGERVVSFDIAEGGHRLDQLLSYEEQQAITFVKGDLSQFASVQEALSSHQITHIIHLAALQVPFCRQNPVRGAEVNVVGTTNIFEAARQANIAHIAYASSIAVYGPPDAYPAGPIVHRAPFDPRTIYGVYKVANEGTAKIYWQDHGLSSSGLRPHTVYGLGRDQGLTSDPTKAILAAAQGEDFHINFGGRIQLQWASDVARQFILAVDTPIAGANVYNLGGPVVAVAELAERIQRLNPAVKISAGDKALPFPDHFDDVALKEAMPSVYETTLDDGLQTTFKSFQYLIADGKLPSS